MSDQTFTPVIANTEQSLCARCGLCCDGTIFGRARVFAEDDPARLKAGGFILLATAARTGFTLPCHHQRGRLCAIYQQWRPQVCHTFRCALLRSVEAGQLSVGNAHARIERAVALAERIRAQLPAQGEHERKTLTQRMAAWRQAQTAAGGDARRACAALLLDFACLQRLLDLHFRIKANMEATDEMPAPDAQ
jgi:hypothetical protein